MNAFNDQSIAISTVEDMTSEKKANALYKKLIVQMDSLINRTNDLIWTVNADDYGLMMYNSAFEQFFAKDRKVDVHLGMTPSELVPPGYDEKWIGIYKRAIEEGTYEFEYEVISKSTTLLFSVSPLYDDDRLFGVSVFGKNITERKRYEQELIIAKEKAEAANIAKDAFLANISHEIRTPINGIMGLMQLAMMTNLTDDQREYLTTALHSSKLLVDLLTDVIDFSKIESERLELEKVALSINEIITEVLTQYQEPIQAKKIGIELQLDEGLNRVLYGDRNKIKLTLSKLIENAIKFTPSGKIIIHTDILVEKQDTMEVHIHVEDTGIGIPQEKIAQIFEKFEQLDMSSTRQYGGTGLGLSLCKGYVDLMKGRIWVESRVGVGSQFNFTFEIDKTN